MPEQLAKHVKAAVDLITANRVGTSIVEIRRALEAQGLETKGEIAVENGDCPNLVIWAGMSQEFADVLKAVLCDKRIEATPTSILVYMCDGEALTLPIAQRPPKNGYREPHWVPVCFGIKPTAKPSKGR